MSKRQKQLQKLRNNPLNVPFDELRQVLESAGFELDHTTGSHHIFRQQIGAVVLRVTIPFARPVKSRYVKQALQAIDAADLARQQQAQVVETDEEEATDDPAD
jgi:predicted RNA binding protein YcfA (HicA-like mRNA interferase family)